MDNGKIEKKMRPKLYKIKKIGSDKGQVVVEPTDYLQTLGPREAIDALRAHCNWLASELRRAADVDVETTESFKKTARLLYELEVAQKYLVCLQEDYVARVSRNRLK